MMAKTSLTRATAASKAPDLNHTHLTHVISKTKNVEYVSKRVIWVGQSYVRKQEETTFEKSN